jgi:hypothetical protein
MENVKKDGTIYTQFASLYNTSDEAIEVMFEPWMTTARLPPKKDLIIEFSGVAGPDVKVLSDLCVSIWMGADNSNVAIYGWGDAVPRAFIDGKELPDLIW